MRIPQLCALIVALCLRPLAHASPQAIQSPAAVTTNTSSLTESDNLTLDPICDTPTGTGGVSKRPKISECMGALRKISRTDAIPISGGGVSYDNGQCSIGLELANVGDIDEVSGEDVWWAATQVTVGCMIAVGNISPVRTAGGMTGLGRGGKVILTLKNPNARAGNEVENNVA